jgi:hypothetical protein
MDEVLFNLAEDVKNFAVVYLVDITEVPDFNTMYELYDPCTVMFFYRYIIQHADRLLCIRLLLILCVSAIIVTNI